MFGYKQVNRNVLRRCLKTSSDCADVTCDGRSFQIPTGALKMQDRRMQDLKMRDQIAGHENAGPENGGPSRNAASLCS